MASPDGSHVLRPAMNFVQNVNKKIHANLLSYLRKGMLQAEMASKKNRSLAAAQFSLDLQPTQWTGNLSWKAQRIVVNDFTEVFAIKS